MKSKYVLAVLNQRSWQALLDKIAKIKNTAKRSNGKYIIDGHEMPIIEYPNSDEWYHEPCNKAWFPITEWGYNFLINFQVQ